ncbi:thiamine pyrophosphate-dependent enzyme [Halioxenophilus aromaticivorans]|uniref:Thiamine pyrophosphate-binding protein n=1 Tax=Halioxenophilus aromaticivorans TaxID=1306992 RepID=A0AAV3TY07_9ALTE
MNPITTADSIIENLIAQGVDTIFGIPGAQTYHLFDSLYRYRDKIKLVVARHEQAAGYMAYGYARSTGKIGVFCVVPGPGVLNATAALCTAHNARVLCLTGQIPSQHIGIGHGMLHELSDQLGILRKLSKWAERIATPNDVNWVMDTAFNKLREGRSAPVCVEVPLDILGQPGLPQSDRLATQPFTTPFTPALIEQQITTAANMLAESSRPLFMVGSGAIDAAYEINQIAERLQCPVVAFRGGRGIVSDDSPYGFTCAEGYDLFDECDLLVGIGTRLELPMFRWQQGKLDKPLIRIDIDPTQHSRQLADIAIEADAKQAAAALLTALEPITPNLGGAAPLRLIKAKRDTQAAIDKVQPQMDYLKVVRKALPEDAILVEEISQMGFASWFGFPVYQPRQLISCGYQGNLGHGLQTALGVKVANPDKVVCSIVGDGGLMFGIQELATAAQFNIPVIVVLFNNNCFGNVRRDQQTLFDNRVYASELKNPDFIKLAQGFGIETLRVGEGIDFEDAFSKALEASKKGPVFIEVPVERGSEVSAWEFLQPAGYGK